MALPLYLKMINKLQVKRDSVGADTTIGQACTAAYNKLDEYYTITTTQRCTHSTVATICDPRLNLRVFKLLWPGSNQEARRIRAKRQFEHIFTKYSKREYDINTIRIEKEAEIEAPIQPKPDSNDELFVLASRLSSELEWVK